MTDDDSNSQAGDPFRTSPPHGTYLTKRDCHFVHALLMCASDDDMERFVGNEDQITQQELNDLLERLESRTGSRGDEPVPVCTPERLAMEFSKIIRSWLTVEEMEEVISRNKTQTCDDVCHSHDFCDANMAMEEALGKVGLPSMHDENFADADVLNPITSERWGKAWSIAKRNEFRKG